MTHRTRAATLGAAVVAVALVLAIAGWMRSATVAATQSARIVGGTFSAEQARGGRTRFESVCGGCHAPSRFAGNDFMARWNGRTVAELVRFLTNAEPQAIHGGFPGEHYVELAAFMLQTNGFPSGEASLPTEMGELGTISIEWPGAPE